MWNSYLLQSWKCVLMWEYPYIDCMCSKPLGESWIWCGCKSHLSSGYAGSCRLGSRWGWRWRGYSWSQVWGGTSPLLSSHHYPTGGEVWSQVAGTETLRVWSKLALFHLSVCFPPPSTGTPASDGGISVARGAHVGSWLLLATDKRPKLSPMHCLTLLRHSLECKSPSFLTAHLCHQLPLPCCGATPVSR